MTPEGMEDLIGKESSFMAGLSKLMAVNESYPELKGDQNMLELQEELVSTENRIAFSRQHYNDSALYYNNEREVFPNNLISGMFNFREATLWKIDEEMERKNLKIKF